MHTSLQVNNFPHFDIARNKFLIRFFLFFWKEVSSLFEERGKTRVENVIEIFFICKGKKLGRKKKKDSTQDIKG